MSLNGTLILTKSNSEVSANNSTFLYDFGSSFNAVKGDQIACVSVNVFNSTFNISSAFQNNTITFVFNSATPVSVLITIPDGYYSCSDINNILQSFMLSNLLYLINTSNQIVYYFEAVVNAPRYGIQFNSYAIPTSAQATALGLTQPAGATWSYPATAKNAQLTISNKFGLLLGFEAGTYPSTITTSDVSVLSSKCPVLSTVSCYIMLNDMISNKYASPTTTMFAIPLTESFGSLVSEKSNQLVWNNISEGSHSNMRITLVDQNLRAVNLQDNDIVISFALRNRYEQ